MPDVILQVTDITTGQSVGTFNLTLSQPQTYNISVGNYLFTATYLQTGQIQTANVNIVEGTNPPLNFTFTPAPITTAIIVNPCTSLTSPNGWVISEGGGGTGLSTMELNTTKPGTTEPPSIELAAGAGCWGVWFGQNLWKSYNPFVPLDLSKTPVLSFDVASDLQDPTAKISIDIVTNPWTVFSYGVPVKLTTAFQRVSVDLRVDENGNIPDLTQIGWMHIIVSGAAALTATTTVQIGNMTADIGASLPLQTQITPTQATMLTTETASFNSITIGGTTPYAYNWTLDGVTISTTKTCTVGPVPLVGNHPLILTITDAAGNNVSQTTTVNIIALLPPPINPSPWRTQGSQVIDFNNKLVYMRGIGTPAYESASPSGMWTQIGDTPFNYGKKWAPIDANLKTAIDQNLQCMNTYWYCNVLRTQGMQVNWWMIDQINSTTYGQSGYGNVTISYRDYWELLVQRALVANMQVLVCLTSVLDYYTANGQNINPLPTPDSGGQPGNLTANGKAYMSTINADELTAWATVWTSIIQRLGKYPNVIWELWNEPNGNATAQQNYYNYAIAMYKAIRATGDNHIILIQWNWGAVPLAGYAEEWVPDFHAQLVAAIGGEPTNIIYTTHCYLYAPYYNSSWGTNYATIYSQMTAPNFVPMVTNLKVPLWVDECGVLLGLTGQALSDSLAWYEALLQVCRQLDVGISTEFWMPTGIWPYSEALLQPGIWSVNTPSPVPSSSGQMFINAYTPPLPSIMLTVAAGANGSVTPTGNVQLNIGQPYLFGATADAGFILDHWNLGNINVGSNNPLTLTPTAAMNGEVLTAIFTPITPNSYTLQLNSNPVGATIIIDGISYTTPVTVTLPAGTHAVQAVTPITIAGQTYNFQSWQDGTTNPSQTLQLSANGSVTATYAATPHIPKKALAALGLLGIVSIGAIVASKKKKG